MWATGLGGRTTDRAAACPLSRKPGPKLSLVCALFGPKRGLWSVCTLLLEPGQCPCGPSRTADRRLHPAVGDDLIRGRPRKASRGEVSTGKTFYFW